jgi:DNA polymerase V
MELTDLWGVAGRLAQRLKALGINNPLELRDADPRFVRGHCSVVLERMVYELRGVPCLGLEQVTPDRKSLMASRSFGRAVESRRELEEAVAVYAARAAERMRRQRLATANLLVFLAGVPGVPGWCSWLVFLVFLQTNRFKPADRQYAASKSVHLPVATADTGKLIKAAIAALGALYRPGYRYKKAGVILLDLVPAAGVQAGLFDAPDDARSIARMRAIDALNARFGHGTVAFGTAGERRRGACGGNSYRRATRRFGMSCCKYRSKGKEGPRCADVSRNITLGRKCMRS